MYPGGGWDTSGTETGTARERGGSEPERDLCLCGERDSDLGLGGGGEGVRGCPPMTVLPTGGGDFCSEASGVPGDLSPSARLAAAKPDVAVSTPGIGGRSLAMTGGSGLFIPYTGEESG